MKYQVETVLYEEKKICFDFENCVVLNYFIDMEKHLCR